MGCVIAVMALAILGALREADPVEVDLTFEETANRHPVSGFGGEWDPHFWRKPNVRRGCDEAQWQVVCRRIKDMGIGRVRMMILPDWYEPDNDDDDARTLRANAFTWDSEPMLSLYRHLEACRDMGIRVTLTWWCAPAKRQSDGAPYWLATPGVKEWCTAPNDVEEAAENVVAGLRHLIEERGYSCIDAFTFYNEPDWAFFGVDNEVDFDHYRAICMAIDRRLCEVGLRDRLELDLADASMHKGWLEQSAKALDEVADRYNVHSYVFSCADEGYPQAIRAWIRTWVQQCGDKPLATNELGTRHYKGAYSATDVDTFERAFLTSQYAILGLCEGMTGAIFWGLYDQYYYDGAPDDGSNGGRMMTNLMAYVDDGWRIRPTGQAWTLICHGAPVGARVHPGTSAHADVDAVMTRSDTAGTQVLAVNRGATVRVRHLTLSGAKGRVTRALAYTRNGLVEAESDAESVLLPTESVVRIELDAQP